ncbi:MAG: hypothetical protein KDD61_14350 [Bdellovibrionales bacterium]|nr:hypothetical protein [Bdellovibrionales bacterium]
MKPKFFMTQSELRSWFSEQHETSAEIWIGFYKKNSGKTSVTYAEAVDEALCFGWIDGIRKKIDEYRYTNRFTPRRKKSNWSNNNIENVKRLKKAGRMTPSGLREVDRAKADGRIK